MRRAIPVRQPHPKAQRQTQGPFQTGFIKIETVSRPAARPVPSGLRRTRPAATAAFMRTCAICVQNRHGPGRAGCARKENVRPDGLPKIRRPAEAHRRAANARTGGIRVSAVSGKNKKTEGMGIHPTADGPPRALLVRKRSSCSVTIKEKACQTTPANAYILQEAGSLRQGP